MEKSYGLDMADGEEIVALRLCRSALLSHSLLLFHSPPSAASYMAFKFIIHSTYPLWVN